MGPFAGIYEGEDNVDRTLLPPAPRRLLKQLFFFPLSTQQNNNLIQKANANAISRPQVGAFQFATNQAVAVNQANQANGVKASKVDQANVAQIALDAGKK